MGENKKNGTNGSGNGHDDGRQGEDNIIRMPSLAERDRMRREKEEQEQKWRDEYAARGGRPGASGGGMGPSQNTGPGPFLNVPPATKALLLIFVAVHVISHAFLNEVQLYTLFERFGFVPAYYTDGLVVGGDHLPFWVLFTGPVTYTFIHGSWMHLGLNCVMLMAFGTGVERWIGGKRMIVFFMSCSLLSVGFHFLLNMHSTGPVIGASGGLSGLFSAALYMFYQHGHIRRGRYGLLPVILVWVVISVVFGEMGGPSGESIAWAAHIGGFLAGFLLIKPVMRLRI